MTLTRARRATLGLLLGLLAASAGPACSSGGGGGTGAAAAAARAPRARPEQLGRRDSPAPRVRPAWPAWPERPVAQGRRGSPAAPARPAAGAAVGRRARRAPRVRVASPARNRDDTELRDGPDRSDDQPGPLGDLEHQGRCPIRRPPAQRPPRPRSPPTRSPPEPSAEPRAPAGLDELSSRAPERLTAASWFSPVRRSQLQPKTQP